jgi:hypothetical protein
LKESGTNAHHNGSDTRRRKLVQEAFLSLIDLRGEPVPVLVAGELYLMYTRLIDEQRRLKEELHFTELQLTPRSTHTSDPPRVKLVEHISWWERVQLMFFRRGTTRRAHLAAAAVMISQQLCGINLLAFLADTFLRHSLFHHNHEATPVQNTRLLGFSVALMGISFFATIGALFIIDRGSGRRTLLNWSFPCMALFLQGSALVLLPRGSEPSAKVVAVHYTFLILFTIAYSIGEGPAAFVISAEVFPLVNRELGMSLAVFWNFLGAGILAVFAPALWKALDQFGVLTLFAGTNLLAWFLCNWLVPNTGNEDLEEVFKQLDYTSGFLLRYTLKTLLRRTTKPLDWCFNLFSKPWSQCGFGRKLESREDEFRTYQAKGHQRDAAHTRESDEMEMMEM